MAKPANTLESMSKHNRLPPIPAAMIEKVQDEVICEYCGLPNANELGDHPLLGECIICDECNTLSLEETRKMEDSVKNLVNHAEIRFRDRVKIKRRICDACAGDGWVDIH